MSELNLSTAECYYSNLLYSRSMGHVLQLLVGREVGSEFTARSLTNSTEARMTTVSVAEQLRLRLAGVGMVERLSQGDGSTSALYRIAESPLWEGTGVLLGNIADLSRVDAST